MSIADDIRSAAASLSEPAEAPAEPTVEATDATPAEPTVAETPAPEPVKAETPAETMARVRDDKGRFAPKTTTPAPKAAESTQTQPPAAAAPTPTEAPKPAETTPSVKAPQSWKPAAREKFAALPPEVQEEVVRVDREVRQVMQTSAEARRQAEQFNALVTPYRALMTDEPLKVVANLLQTAAALRTAPPQHKAQLVASIVKEYGVDIDALDAALVGAPQPATQPQQPNPAQFRDPRIDQMIQSVQAKRQQEMQRELEEFSQKAEFFEDVRETMATLVSGGIATTLKDAYDKACLLKPDVSAVLKQREEAAAAKAKLASTQRAREAGSLSIRSQPAATPPTPHKGGSIMDDLMAAKDRLSQ